MMDANMREAIAFNQTVNEIKRRYASMDAHSECIALIDYLMEELEDWEIPKFVLNDLYAIKKLVQWEWRYGI
jgi:hypothetical protein